jgi:hypothetical protein
MMAPVSDNGKVGTDYGKLKAPSTAAGVLIRRFRGCRCMLGVVQMVAIARKAGDHRIPDGVTGRMFSQAGRRNCGLTSNRRLRKKGHRSTVQGLERLYRSLLMGIWPKAPRANRRTCAHQGYSTVRARRCGATCAAYIWAAVGSIDRIE